MGDNNSITISLRELYDLIQDMAKSQQRIESRLEKLEAKWEYAALADERSREALEIAKDAMEMAEKLEKRQWWLWSAIALLGLKALFNFANQLGG